MARGQRDLAVVGDPAPLGQAVHRLLDDLHRLVDLRDADGEAIPVVALGADRDLELEVVVGAVGRRLAQVPRVAGGAQQRAGDAELEQLLLGERADAAQALQDDLVVGEQVVVLIDARRHLIGELLELLGPAARDVLGDAADLEVARVHALAGGLLEEVEDQLAVAEAVPEHRHRAEVQRARPEPHEVAHDPVELHVDDAQVLRARRHVDLEQRLGRAAEGIRVEEVREVVHALDDRDRLPVGLVLGRLLDAGVDVADDRLEIAHDLALERHEQAQHPVRGGMVGTHVEREQLMVHVVGAEALDRRHRDRLLHLAVLRRAAGDVGRAHWVYALPSASSMVKRIGSPPIGKSRRCGWPS